MKSGYPDYLKSGFTRTILVTEKHASNSDTQIVKITLILEHFFMIFTFMHGTSAYQTLVVTH